MNEFLPAIATPVEEESLETVGSGLTLWDIVDDITNAKHGVEADEVEGFPKAYVPFMVTKALSMFQDTVLIANEMNRRSRNCPIPSEAQYLFYSNLIAKRYRRARWPKSNEDDIAAVAKVLGESKRVAAECLKLFTPQQMAEIRATAGAENESFTPPKKPRGKKRS